MTGAGMGRGGKNTSLLTRRNKCAMVILFCVLFFFVLLVNAGLFSNGPAYSGELIRLDEIELQRGFDPDKFSGSWYGTYTKGMDNSLVAALLEFTDVKVNFILRDDGKFDVRSVGGKFYGMWCPEGEGHSEAKDANSPQKLGVFFDTPTGKKFGRKAAWVVKTDYTSYAVIYSCWEETDDGYCHAKSTYGVVLQRDKAALPESKMADVREALSRSGINPDAIRPIQHKGKCRKEQKLVERTDLIET